MKVITVPADATFFYQLLMSNMGDDLILQTPDGRRFMLSSLEGWEGFDVGNGNDFAREVAATGQHPEVLTVLAERRRHGKRVPLDALKTELGLDE
jgi:hypothetical protein